MHRPAANGDTVKLVRRSFDAVDVHHTGIVTKSGLLDAFAAANHGLCDADASSLIDELGFVHHAHRCSFDEFLSSILEKEILIRHRLGKSLAEVLNLTQVRQGQEVCTAQRDGIVLRGRYEDVVEKLNGKGFVLAKHDGTVDSETFEPTTPKAKTPGRLCRYLLTRRPADSGEGSPTSSTFVDTSVVVTFSEGASDGYTVLRCHRGGKTSKAEFYGCVSAIFESTLNSERQQALLDTEAAGESELV